MVNEDMLDQKEIESIFSKRQFRVVGDEYKKDHLFSPDTSGQVSKSTTPSLSKSKKTAQSRNCGVNGIYRNLLSANM